MGNTCSSNDLFSNLFRRIESFDRCEYGIRLQSGFSPLVAFGSDDSTEPKAIEKIELLGCRVTRDDTSPLRPVIDVTFSSSTRINEEYLYLLKPFMNRATLDHFDATIADGGFKTIGELNSLKALNLTKTSES